MSQPSFAGVWGKFDRAGEHLETLERELGDLIESDAYVSRGKLESEGTEYVLRSYSDDPNLTRFGLILGDGIQNLRTALNHLLCQLVIASDGEVTKQHQFPIYTYEPKGRTVERWRQMTEGISDHLLDALKNVQPYKATDDPPESVPLAVLADLSNADKHRLVLPVVMSVSEEMIDAFRPVPHDLAVIGKAKATVSKPLKNGTEILRFPVRVTGPDPHVKMQGHIPLDVAFGEQLYTSRGMAELREYVRVLLKAFEQLLG